MGSYGSRCTNSSGSRPTGISHSMPEPAHMLGWSWTTSCNAGSWRCKTLYERLTQRPGTRLLTYMKYPLLSHFREVCGIRTARRDPLNNCASLDKPVGDEGDTTLGDLQPSQSAAQDMEAALEWEYTRELHEAIGKALDTLDEPQRETIRRRYWNRETLQAVAKDIGVTPEVIRQRETKALRRLRCGPCVKLLKPFVDEIRDGYAWRGTSWGAWNSTGVSSVEKAAEKTEALMMRISEQQEREKAHFCALLHITPEEFDRRYSAD